MSQSQSQRPLRILSLDGGGYRGISTLAILKELMKQLAEPSGKEPKPCEVFDFIIGTSTGGLIALLLGRLGLSVDEAREKYIELGKRIFVDDKGNFDYIWNGTSRYDTGKLEGFYKDILGDKQLGSPGTVRTAVTTTLHERSVNDAILLRTYTDTVGALPPTSSSYSWTAIQAARATSAAPTYFNPITVDGTTFADAGGAGFNNPTEVGIREVAMVPVWRDRAIGAVVSLGTGLNDEAYTSSPSQADVHLNPVAVSNAQPYGVMAFGLGGLGGLGGLINPVKGPGFPPIVPTPPFQLPQLPDWMKVDPPKKYYPGDPTGGLIGSLIEDTFNKGKDGSKRLEKLTTYFANIASNSEQTHLRMLYSPYKDVYWRFNVPMIGKYDLADVEKGPDMESRTNNYLQEATPAAAMKKLVKMLKA